MKPKLKNQKDKLKYGVHRMLTNNHCLKPPVLGYIVWVYRSFKRVNDKRNCRSNHIAFIFNIKILTHEMSMIVKIQIGMNINFMRIEDQRS